MDEITCFFWFQSSTVLSMFFWGWGYVGGGVRLTSHNLIKSNARWFPISLAHQPAIYRYIQKLTSTLFVSGKKVQPLVYCTPTHPKLKILIYIYIERERYRHDSLENVCPFKHGNFGHLPSLKLTVSTWKWMVGIRSFPFAMAYFLGYVSFRECKFRLCNTQVKWAMKKTWLFRVYRGRDNTTQLHGDHFTNNYKDPMKQPVHPGRLRAGTYKSFGKDKMFQTSMIVVQPLIFRDVSSFELLEYWYKKISCQLVFPHWNNHKTTRIQWKIIGLFAWLKCFGASHRCRWRARELRLVLLEGGPQQPCFF